MCRGVFESFIFFVFDFSSGKGIGERYGNLAI
jgi:hypothetical protein